MNYYSVLGVNRDATQKELKQAYKKQSMKYHPDRPDGDENEFKKVNEAYSALSDPQKRQMYDQFGTIDPQQAQAQQHQYHFHSGDINDILNQFGFNNSFHQRPMRNSDINIGVDITLADIYHGKNITVAYRTARNEEKTVNIEIPRGLRPGQKIRYAGMGNTEDPRLTPGDLFAHIRVHTMAGWDIDGINLLTVKEVSTLDLITGTKITIHTPEGKNIEMKIPAGTDPETVFSLSNAGLPDRKTAQQGHILVRIKGKTPKLADTTLRDRIEQIKQNL